MKTLRQEFILYFIILSAINLSCTDSVKKIDNKKIKAVPIKLDAKSILKLSDFVDSMDIIPLETNDNCLVSEVRKIIFHNDIYYIRTTRWWQNGKLFAFDKNGKFLFQVGRTGLGPGEYVNLSDFSIVDSTIKIAQYGKLISYNLNGIFQKEIKNEINIKEFHSLSSNVDLIYSREAYKRNNNLLTVLDSTGNITYTLMEVSKKGVDKSEANYNPNSLLLYNNTILFNYPYCDTIYEIRNRKCSPLYYVDYMGKKVPDNLFEEGDGAKEMMEKEKKFGDYATTCIMGFSEHFLYIGSRDSYYNGYFTLYSKETEKILTGRNIIDDMFLIGNGLKLSVKTLPSNMIDGYLYWQVEPSVILNGYEKMKNRVSKDYMEQFKNKHPKLADICSTIKEDDNPVLLKIKLKNF